MVSAPEFDEHCALVRPSPAQQGDVDRYRYYARLYSFYTLNDFCYSGSNTRRLFESLSTEERLLYPFDVTSFDWKTYFLDSHLPGLFRLAARLGLNAGAVIRDGSAEAYENAFALPDQPMA